jgi:ParB/RepB/Spo0J family partition protein
METQALLILVANIIPNPEQPRKEFDEAALKELADSIKEHGVILAIAVEDSGNGWYTLTDGERRWRAARIAGLEMIPALVSPLALSDETARRQRLARALAANIQRANLNDVEEAQAFQSMHDLGMTDAQIAKSISKSRSYITNKRGLLDLPDQLRAPLAQGRISERQAMALKPLYELPAQVIEAAENSWRKPSELLKNPPTDSSDIRESVRNIIASNTTALKDLDFAGHDFGDLAGALAPACADCPIAVKYGKNNELRCPDVGCRDTKKKAWVAVALERASADTGLPVYAGGHRGGEIEYFWGEDEMAALRVIRQKGCPNLKLMYQDYSGGNLVGHEHISLFCHHGGKDGRCTCMAAAKAQVSRTDPAKIAERKLEREIAAMVEDAAAVVQAAIASGSEGVWRLITHRFVHNSEEGKLGKWDLNQLQASIARRMVNNTISWNARHTSAAAVQDEIVAFLESLGMALPDEDPSSDARRRLVRIQGWIKTLGIKEIPTFEAVRGNLDNIQKIAADLDGDGLDEKVFAELSTGLERASNTLSDLYALMREPGFDLISIAADARRVSCLLTVPVGDSNFDNDLKEGSALLIRYALVLLPEENNANKRKVLERRLRALSKNGHENVSVQTPAEEVANA